MKILLLEDDLILNELIQESLTEENYTITSVFDGYEAEELIYEEEFDLLLFDINVPNITGFNLLERIRKNNIKTPLIFISSRDTENDLKTAFKLGCQDYLKKPFHLSELKLRIENIKKLTYIGNTQIIQINDTVSYNYQTKAILNQNENYSLSNRESKILEYFIKNKNQTISIDEISINNWTYDEMPAPTTIRTYIKNLRKKLNNDAITTLKGIGYVFSM
jgi:DNA-binding response OmpR family regulator